MDDLVADVDRGTELGQGALDDFDRSFDTGAESRAVGPTQTWIIRLLTIQKTYSHCGVPGDALCDPKPNRLCVCGATDQLVGPAGVASGAREQYEVV